LAKTAPDLDDKIRFVPPIFLDYLAVQLGDWSGYHLLASYLHCGRYAFQKCVVKGKKRKFQYN